ncbi:MAG: Holliday junction resolvase RuvX [Clostridia bacterium]|nr:Holliday junction resolvase RuvX [Clostridia bacterium]
MRILGVDYGEARTGVAISDELNLTAQGVKTVFGRNSEKVAAEVSRIAKQYDVKLVVVGLPKNMDNTIGFRGEATMEFVEKLKPLIDCPIELWDERLTTVSAIRVLNETNTRGNKRKNVVDTVAACIILQNYIDFKGGN